MDPAISTLVGTALGGVLGAGSGLLLERFRASREREAAARIGRLDARRAARLVAEELLHDHRRVDTALERGIYTWEPADDLLPTATWNEYRADFAASAAPESWAAVAAAYVEINRLNEHVVGVIEEERWTGVPPNHPLQARDLDPRVKEYAKEAAARIAAALECLDALMATEA